MTPTRSVVCSPLLPPPPPSSSPPHAATPSASATAIPRTKHPRRIMSPPSSDRYPGAGGNTPDNLASWRSQTSHQLFGFFVEDAPGDGERGVRGGHAAVDRGLEQDLLDLVARQAVAERGADV